jgi:NAD+ synthase
MIQEIEDFLAERARLAHVKGFVVGISGGLDSALVLALCARLRPEFEVIPVSLPCDSSVDTLECTKLVCDAFHAPYQTSDITEAAYEAEMALPQDRSITPLVLGNINARIRMTMLYAYANMHNCLVVGTTNLTEMTLGYYTKHGDGACDIEPIAHLTKFEVRVMATTLGVPDRIVNRVPSADLWAGQTDEGELGFSYDHLDGAVLRLLMPTALPMGTLTLLTVQGVSFWENTKVPCTRECSRLQYIDKDCA